MKRFFHGVVVVLCAIGAIQLGVLGYNSVFSLLHAQPRSPVIDGNAGVRHIAFIMDGNRRWAKDRKLMPWDGHRSGVGPVKEAVLFCLAHGIEFLSLYAFSLENFKRSRDELLHLFDVVETGLSPRDIQELAQHGVKICFVGDRSLFPPRLVKTITAIEDATKEGTKLVVNILFCYGGHQELRNAAQRLAAAVANGALRPSEITEDHFAKHLWTGNCPPPDMVVRSGGERRLSNFMPWQTAYSELFFVDTYWPAITRADFEALLVAFDRRKRNFGA